MTNRAESGHRTDWVEDLLGASVPEGERVELEGESYTRRRSILRQQSVYSGSQAQTQESFGFKWARRDTYESEAFQEMARRWLVERYLERDESRLASYAPDGATVLDAGCGAGHSAGLLFGDRLMRLRYLGVDISDAVDVARERFAERGWPGSFMQADFTRLPFRDAAFDVILAEGTLHHTDSTEGALAALTPLLRAGGHFLFYVYRTKGPLREFTDDLVRERIAGLDDQAAWEALLPLTRLGKALGELGITVDIPEPIDVLGIPAGSMDLQRLFYWHVVKAFYRPDLSLEEMNHINFDWFRPTNAHRQTVEEVRAWCDGLGLEIIRLDAQEAGITVVARRGSAPAASAPGP